MSGSTYTPQLHNLAIPLSVPDPLRNDENLTGDKSGVYGYAADCTGDVSNLVGAIPSGVTGSVSNLIGAIPADVPLDDVVVMLSWVR